MFHLSYYVFRLVVNVKLKFLAVKIEVWEILFF